MIKDCGHNSHPYLGMSFSTLLHKILTPWEMIFPKKPTDTNKLRCWKAQNEKHNCSERSLRRWQAVVWMCLTYWSQCLWAGPEFGKSETGWCRCAAANPPYPRSVSSYCDRWGWSRPCFPPADRAWRHEPFVTSLIHHSSTAHHKKSANGFT